MQNTLMIALGAAVGANLRYLVSQWAARQWGTTFPGGTLLINLLGSLLIGVLASLFAERLPVREPVRLLLITGLLGGFTTFSTFSLDIVQLLSSQEWRNALLYVIGSVGGGLLAALLGVWLVRLLP